MPSVTASHIKKQVLPPTLAREELFEMVGVYFELQKVTVVRRMIMNTSIVPPRATQRLGE